MDQPTFADLECQVQKRKTRREPFPERSDTAKCATGMLAKDTERLTPLSGLGNLLAAKGNWGEGKLGRSARCNRPGPDRGFRPTRRFGKHRPRQNGLRSEHPKIVGITFPGSVSFA